MRVIRWLSLVLSVFVAAPCAVASASAAADRDGDKVFDDLQAQLVTPGPHPIMVALRGPATAARVQAIEADLGDLGKVERLRLVDAFTARGTTDQIRALAERPDVAHVEDDARVVPFGVTAQASFGVTRAREDLPGLDGAGLVAAVIDSGINTTLADLPSSKVVAFADLVNGADAPYDDLGHGTLVADILAGTGASGPEGRGVAPAAGLVGVKVIDSRGQSSLGKIAEGLQWAVEHRAQYGIDVVNLSIGDPVGCGAGTDVASRAVDAAVAAGLVVVAAAGNAGPEPCTVKSPAAAESALTVGAMSDLGAGGFAAGWFSSRGPTLDGRMKPDISAPGVNVIVSTPRGTHEPQMGTSAAAPFVSGVALLMLQAQPSLTPAAVKAAMTATAIDFGRPGRDTAYGAGRLDAYAALREVGAPLAAPPASPEQMTWAGTLKEGESATREVEIADPRFPLAVTLDGPGVGFDLALLDAEDRTVGSGVTQFGGSSRQEDLSVLVPASGRYTVRVTARAGTGDFVVDLSGGFALDATGPALTLERPGVVRRAYVGGVVGTATGDFPGVVVRVRRGKEVVRRVAASVVGAAWSASFTLDDGEYTLDAEQGDRAGNITRVMGPLVLDTVAPLVGIDAIGHVTSTEGVPECRVDAGAWGSCGKYDGLPAGVHTLEARAADAAGNWSAVEHRTWTVAAPETTTPASATSIALPGSTATGGTTPDAAGTTAATAPPTPSRLTVIVPKQRLASVLKRGLSVRATCSTRCRATVVVTQGRKVVARGTGGTLRLTAAARKALAKLRRVALTVTVTAPGAATVSRTVRLSR